MTVDNYFVRYPEHPKNAQLGDHYIVEGGCPDCGADLCTIAGVAVWCSTHGEWGHDSDGCGYRFMAGWQRTRWQRRRTMYYRHCKGNVYTTIGTATHTETGEELVLYRPVEGDDKRVWARPYDMFHGVKGR